MGNYAGEKLYRFILENNILYMLNDSEQAEVISAVFRLMDLNSYSGCLALPHVDACAI